MNKERMYQIIRYPVISEKSTRIAERHNQAVFEVAKATTKSEVKQAVQGIYNVRVVSVQMLNRKGKTKRFKFQLGKQLDRKVAFVRLHADDDIDFTQQVEA